MNGPHCRFYMVQIFNGMGPQWVHYTLGSGFIRRAKGAKVLTPFNPFGPFHATILQRTREREREVENEAATTSCGDWWAVDASSDKKQQWAVVRSTSNRYARSSCFFFFIFFRFPPPQVVADFVNFARINQCQLFRPKWLNSGHFLKLGTIS